MSAQRDPAILLAFVDEARSYLPGIRDGLLAYLADESQTSDIQSAYRLIHTIAGAASMVGLDELSAFARSTENILEEVRARRRHAVARSRRRGAGQLDEIEQRLARHRRRGGGRGGRVARDGSADRLPRRGIRVRRIARRARAGAPQLRQRRPRGRADRRRHRSRDARDLPARSRRASPHRQRVAGRARPHARRPPHARRTSAAARTPSRAPPPWSASRASPSSRIAWRTSSMRSMTTNGRPRRP